MLELTTAKWARDGRREGVPLGHCHGHSGLPRHSNDEQSLSSWLSVAGVRRRDARREEAPGSAASRWLAGLAVRSKSSNGTSMRPGQRGGGAASFRLAEISSSASFMSFIPFMVFLSMSSVEPRVFS